MSFGRNSPCGCRGGVFKVKHEHRHRLLFSGVLLAGMTPLLYGLEQPIGERHLYRLSNPSLLRWEVGQVRRWSRAIASRKPMKAARRVFRQVRCRREGRAAGVVEPHPLHRWPEKMSDERAFLCRV